MNRTSSFIVLASLFLLCPIIAMAQQQATGRVTDALTGEPIPFATMYVSASKGTLTNGEGEFAIDLAAGETLQVSFMGYRKRQFAAGSVLETIRLEPTDTQMKEFTVVAPNSILEKIVKCLDSEYKARESKSANFFLRQTFEQENGRSGQDMQPTLSVSGLKPEYAPYEPVSLRVKSRQGEGCVSLTVRDDNMRDFLHDSGSILTEMLLASEIRGFVPQPGWYFERDDEERRTGLAC